METFVWLNFVKNVFIWIQVTSQMSWIPHSFCEALHDVTTWEWHRVRLQSNSVVTSSLLDKHHCQHLCPWCQTANRSFILLGRPKDGRVCSQLSVCFLRSLILYFYLLSVAGFRESIFFKLTRHAFSLLPNWWNGFQETREGGYFGFESFHYIFFSLYTSFALDKQNDWIQ